MKETKKLNSIATLTEEEMVNTKGGALSYAVVDIFPYGIPVDHLLSKISILDKSAIILRNPVETQVQRF